MKILIHFHPSTEFQFFLLTKRKARRGFPDFSFLGSEGLARGTSTRSEAKNPGKPGSKTRSEAILLGGYMENNGNRKKMAREARPGKTFGSDPGKSMKILDFALWPAPAPGISRGLLFG